MSDPADPMTDKTRELVQRTNQMDAAMKRLRDLRDLRKAITVGMVKRTGSPPEITTMVEIGFHYQKVSVLVADASPDLADRLADMIEAEDNRLNDMRRAF